jgi:hypothetical protein
MLARKKYREASYFYTQMSKASDEPDAFRHNLSAFLSGFRSVTLYLQAESSSDPRFGSWYEEKRNKMRGDPILRLLNEQRRVTVHERPARVIGKFTVYVADPTMAMAEAVQALLKAPDGSTVTYFEPPELPQEFVESGDRARVERQFFFNGHEERDLFALCLEGLFALDRIIGSGRK